MFTQHLSCSYGINGPLYGTCNDNNCQLIINVLLSLLLALVVFSQENRNDHSTRIYENEMVDCGILFIIKSQCFVLVFSY